MATAAAPTAPPAPAPRAAPAAAPTPTPTPKTPAPGSGRGPTIPAPVASAGASVAGFLLALVAWGWVAMPFLTGGKDQVKKVLMAKFINKTPDGEWLP